MRRLGFTIPATTTAGSVTPLLFCDAPASQDEQSFAEEQKIIFPIFNVSSSSSCSFFNAQNVLPAASSSLTTTSSATLVSLPPIVASAFTSQRFLRVAKSPHGYYISRRGRFAQHWPRYRRPHHTNPQSALMTPPWHWRRFAPVDPNAFLPKHNYVTGPWIGQFFMHLHQVYTLQHCNAGVPIRVKRFPTAFEFKQHSRWMIGKAMRTWVEPRAHIFDEAALTKKARLDLVKKGLMPPG